MPTACEKQQPTYRVRMHIPANAWHQHTDKTFTVKNATEWGAWAELMGQTLQALAHNNARLSVGYWLDAINFLPDNFRKAIVMGIGQGKGLEIAPVPDEPQTVTVNLVDRYEPLIGDKQTKSGLVIPQGAGTKAEILLPGDPRFTLKEDK